MWCLNIIIIIIIIIINLLGVIIAVIIITRCSMPETHQKALLFVACGNPARRRYCMGAKFSCFSSSHAYLYIQQRGRT